MPPLPGHDLGPPPPATPRALPSGYEFRTRFLNLAVLLGLAFTLLPLVFLIPLLKQGHWLASVIPALFVLGGFSCLRHGWRHAAGIIRAFRHGVAIAGQVDSVSLDTTQSVNQKHPWKLTYHFTVEGRLHEGVATSFDSTFAKRSSGQPLWVLYAESDPSQNTLYPPVKYF